MLFVLFTLTILLTFFYVILIFLLYRGLFFLKSGKNKIQYDVSVVVAARNEQENIGNCLEALVHQSYPIDRYEVIIVDDRSTDETAKIVNHYCQEYQQVKLISVKELPTGISPKKHAIEKGISFSKGEIILTTDADCVPQPGWIAGILGYFEPAIGLVAGFSPLISTGKETFFSRLLTLDSLSLAAVAAGSFGLQNPMTCTGRNLAYRKETFQSVNGFKQIHNFVSGDDDLFLHLVRQQTKWKFRYAIDSETIVRSKAPDHLKQLANQRVRHASKGRYYSNGLKLSLATVYLFNLVLLVLLPVSLFVSNIFWLWLACWLVKSSCEFILLFRFANIFHFKSILAVFPLATLLHLLYVVIFGFWGQVGKFQWKADTFETTVH